MPQDYRFSDEAWRRLDQENDPYLEMDEEEEYQRRLRQEQKGPAVRGAGVFGGKVKRNRMRLLNMLRGKPVAPLPKPPPRPVAPGV